MAVEVFQGPLLEVNGQILALAAGREQGLKCSFPRPFCPTATLCQSGYFYAADITSISFSECIVFSICYSDLDGRVNAFLLPSPELLLHGDICKPQLVAKVCFCFLAKINVDIFLKLLISQHVRRQHWFVKTHRLLRLKEKHSDI